MKLEFYKTIKKVAITTLLLSVVTTTTYALDFTDTTNHWGKSNIEYLIDRGSINGYPDGTFRPDGTITRAEFVKIALGSVMPIEVAQEGHWVTLIFDAAVDKGVLKSGEMPESEWDKPITRYEMTMIMSRIAENILNEEKAATEGISNILTDYTTVQQNKYYTSYVEQAYMKGLIKGYEDGSFKGTKTGNRAEACTMLARMLDVTKRIKVDTSAIQWVAPVLKSAWSSNPETNFATLQNELGFSNEGRTYDVKGGMPGAIQVIGQSPDSSSEIGIKFYVWEDSNIKNSYRVPIIAKELFKLYFGNDATRVWKYLNSGDIPDEFTADGRIVKASALGDGSLYLQVGRKVQLSTDEWVAPVLKSAWSTEYSTNLKTLQDELGFVNGGTRYNIEGQIGAIQVIGQGPDAPFEVGLKFTGWESKSIPQSYRVPIVAKELFKLYFEGDADRVWNYVNSGNIPDEFIANGRIVKPSGVSALYLSVGYKQ